MDKKEWFEAWFDSPYYHLLYNNRDMGEAAAFINQLISRLSLHDQAYILDLGCGKGRHAIQLAEKGYHVTGLDISPQSIEYARQFEKENLSFYVHDMRKAYRYQYYDAIFSLFTSFGYFKSARENDLVLRHIYNGLKPKGIFVLDFLNKTKVINGLVTEEQIHKKDVTFDIKREVQDGKIKKHITFEENGNFKTFTESVSAFSLSDLKNMLIHAGFDVIKTAGNYNLDAFDVNKSDRLIIIAQKDKA